MITNKKLSAGQSLDYTGWASYTHLTLATQTINTTPSKLLIDTDLTIQEQQIPTDAINPLWDIATSKIKPISEGDAYDIRISFNVESKTGVPTKISYVLDIGSTTGITNNIYESYVSVDKTPPYKEGFTFPIFCGATFLANGGQIFLFTDVGSVAITSKNIFIIRTHKGR